MDQDLVDEIVSALKESRKYRFLCDDALVRTARWAAARRSGTRDVVKAAKQKLHQVCGAYLDAFDAGALERLMKALPADAPEGALRQTCLTILRQQASTRERIPFMAEAYAEIFRRTTRPHVIVDLACGLNPFALPWMGLPPGATYYACDMDSRIVSAVNRFFSHLGGQQSAVCCDVLVSSPPVEADVAFLLKSAPCLERQQKGAAVDILRRVNAQHLVVSFPTRSLGGRDKGIYGHYRSVMSRAAEALGVRAEEVAYPNETFYLLTKT
jgi:16S rRNA (guanine(1405)-N(7))-methyltransferase